MGQRACTCCLKREAEFQELPRVLSDPRARHASQAQARHVLGPAGPQGLATGSCLLCREVAANTMCLPCGHLLICYRCSLRYALPDGSLHPDVRCPNCKVSVKSFQRVLLQTASTMTRHGQKTRSLCFAHVRSLTGLARWSALGPCPQTVRQHQAGCPLLRSRWRLSARHVQTSEAETQEGQLVGLGIRAKSCRPSHVWCATHRQKACHRRHWLVSSLNSGFPLLLAQDQLVTKSELGTLQRDGSWPRVARSLQGSWYFCCRMPGPSRTVSGKSSSLPMQTATVR